MTGVVTASPVLGLPEVGRGDDLAELIAQAIAAGDRQLEDGDILVLAQKAVSKAEGRVIDLALVEATPTAHENAAITGHDPATVQVILDESTSLLRTAPGVIISETHHGFVCANAGVDHSNTPGTNQLIALPVDPDKSACTIRSRLHGLTGMRVGVVIADSFGRAWRLGQSEVAIGCAGIMPINDLRGTLDRSGEALTATEIAIADQIAAAADLTRSKADGVPAVIISGLGHFVTDQDGPGAQSLLRDRNEDLFR